MDQKQKKKWLILFIILVIANFLTIILPILILFWLARQAKAGVSGTEFIGLLLIPVLLIGVAVLFINVIAAFWYLRKYKPQKTGKVISLTVLVVSFVLLVFPGFLLVKNNLPWYIDRNGQLEKIDRAIEARQPKTIPAKYKSITKKEAVKLLNSCKLKGFYYTNQNDPSSGNGAESSATGIVLTYIDGEPYRISIADKYIDDLVPVARKAQKVCGGPQFWHDGRYEQRQADGTWK